MIFDHCSKRDNSSVKRHSEPPFIWCFPIRQEILNVSQIAVTLHEIRPPSFVQTCLQQYCRCPFFHSAHCSFSNPICFRSVWRWRTMIPGWLPRRLQELSLGYSGSPGKFLFHTGRIATTALPNLVPPRHIDDCYAIHFLHWAFCDLLLLSHQNFPLWARLYQHVFCKKPSLFSSSSRYRSLGLWEVSVNTVLTRTRFHFCSRLHW